MVEQRTENSCVAGSSPAVATKLCPGDEIGNRVSLKRRILRVRVPPGVPMQTKVLVFNGCPLKTLLLY